MGGNKNYFKEAWVKTGYISNGNNYDLGTKKLVLKDLIAATGSISYSNTEATNENIVMTLLTSEALSIVPTGWTKVSDTKYTREVTANTTGSVTMVDTSKNESTINFSVANIDKVAPSVSLDGSGSIVLEDGVDTYTEA